MPDQDQSLEDFFAHLANLPAVQDLPKSEVGQLLQEFCRLLIGMVRGAPPAVVDGITAIPMEVLLERLSLRQKQFKELLADILGAAWLSGRPISPIGADIVHPVQLRMVARKSGTRVFWEPRSAELRDITAAALLAVTTNERRFPFGICYRHDCRRVFARGVRGRLQKYCSRACKEQAVPSAAKRVEYVRNYRRRKQDEEIRRVRALLRRCRKSERYKLLKETFPGRPAKSILYLLRLVGKRSRSPKNARFVGRQTSS